MKKRTILTIVAAMLAASLMLTACGGSQGNSNNASGSGGGNGSGNESSAPVSSGDPIEISLSTPVPETNIVADQIREFCQLVNERTDGRVTINPFYGNVLGNQKDMFTALSNNEQELILDGSITDYYATEYGFMFAPYLIRNPEHLQAIMAGDLYAQMKDRLSQDNVAVLGECIRGTRVTYSSVELKSAEDISKLVIRMPDLSSYITAWTEVGASTQIMGGGDVYSALSTGVVNSCEGPYSQGLSDKYAEVTKYLYPTNHITEPYFIYASKAWLESLPEDVRQVIEETAAEVMEKTTTVCADDAENSRQALVDAGMTYDDSIDFSGLFEKVRPIYEEKFANGDWTSSYDEIMSYYSK